MRETVKILDTPERYGSVSRTLHWGMAVLFGWQFAGALLHAFARETDVARFLWATHRDLGFALLLLLLVRGAWGVANFGRRPKRSSTFLGLAAAVGHLALYVLMFVVPAAALLRQYGSGRAFSPFGLPLMSGFEGGPIRWMTVAGNMLHGALGWVLLALVAGHVAMVFIHRRLWKDDVLSRMAGATLAGRHAPVGSPAITRLGTLKHMNEAS